MAAAKADLGRQREGQAGRVRVGMIPGVATRVISPLLREMGRRSPGVRVTVGEWATDGPVLERVADGSLDLGFAYLPLEPGPFACCELVRAPAVLMVAADSPLARRDRPPALAEIAALPLIARQACRALVRYEEHLRRARTTLDIVVRTDRDETAQALVGAGHGVAVVPRFAVDETDERIAVVELDDQLPSCAIGLVWHRERQLTPAAEELGEIAREVCAQPGRPAQQLPVAA